jgi:hypothetical protein
LRARGKKKKKPILSAKKKSKRRRYEFKLHEDIGPFFNIAINRLRRKHSISRKSRQRRSLRGKLRL